MIKLNRTTEYGLLALSYIRGKSKNELTSAREISDFYGLPFEILAKTLQKLKEQGIISSTYGTRGGYILSKDLNLLNLAEFLKLMEGPISVVHCATETEPCCEYSAQCGIKKPMSALNSRIYDFLARISVEELTREEILRAQGRAEKLMTIASDDNSIEMPMRLQGEEP